MLKVHFLRSNLIDTDVLAVAIIVNAKKPRYTTNQLFSSTFTITEMFFFMCNRNHNSCIDTPSRYYDFW